MVNPFTTDIPEPQTEEFGDSENQKVAPQQRELTFQAIPHAGLVDDESKPVWRLRFDIAGDEVASLGFDVNGEVVLGRGAGKAAIDLSPFKAEELGVSRRHMVLRPTYTQLFALDAGSTNGTAINGRGIGVNTPYSLTSGDVLALGRLQIMVHIIDRPKGETGILRAKADLSDALTEMVKAIAFQLDLDEVLGLAVEAAMTLTSASEAAVWLVDDETGELFLEAEHGVEDPDIRRVRVPVSDSMAGQVVETGQPLRVSHSADEAREEVSRAGYSAEELVYAPVTLGGVTFGVLAAARREAGRPFSDRDTRVLERLADFAAIAVQNSRRYEEVDRSLERRAEQLQAVSRLSREAASSFDHRRVYDLLVQEVQEHWQVDSVALFVVSGEDRQVNVVADSRSRRYTKGAAAQLTLDLVDQVVQTREPRLLSGVDRDAARYSAYGTQEFRSELALPIILDEQVYGVLDLQSREHDCFAQSDVLVLQMLADKLATSLQYARLLKRVNRRNEELERQIAQRMAELEAANEHQQTLSQLRDDFLANLSHELRSPITNLGLLQNVIKTAPPRKRAAYLETMERETKRLEGVVNNLLHLARINQEEAAPEPVQVDLNALVQEYVDDRRPMAQSRGLSLSVKMHANLPPVWADPSLLGQALVILLTNALNYTPSDGWIEVSTHFQVADDERWCGFSVSDNGPGILPEEQPYLFERFFRGTAGRESGTSGVGLGLSILKEIVERHCEGMVEVASEGIPGKGATFTVWLPLADIHLARLLIVDDDETLLGVMHEILSALDYDVQTADSGMAALDRLGAASAGDELPDLIVADVVMPGMTGLQLLESVRANTNWAGIPFLFVSGSTTLAMEGQIAGLDNVHFLRKPFDTETLQEIVAAALRARPKRPDDT